MPALQGLHVRPLLVHRQRHQVHPGGREDLAVQRQPGILDRHLGAGSEHVRQQRDRLHRPAADQHGPLVGHDPADAPQVPGQRAPQLEGAARVGVAEGAVRGLAQHRPLGAQPRPPGEAGEVGVAGEEVVVQGVRLARRGRGGGADRPGGDEGPGSGPRGQVALGQQLGVGVHHQPSRDAEVRGQRAGRGQPRVGGQAPVADRPPQLLLELGPQRPRRAPVEPQQQVPPPELVPIKTSKLVLYDAPSGAYRGDR